MKQYCSYSHATANENGREEVTVEYYKTFFQTIFAMPAEKRVWEFKKIKNPEQGFPGSDWFDKQSGKVCDYDDLIIISHIKLKIYIMNFENDFVS